MEILWKRIVCAEFWVIRPKICRNYAFPQVSTPGTEADLGLLQHPRWSTL